MEWDELVITCSNDSSKCRWRTWNQIELRACGRVTRVLQEIKLICRSPRLVSQFPEAIIGMHNGQNPALRISNWKILSAKEDHNEPSIAFLVVGSAMQAIEHLVTEHTLGCRVDSDHPGGKEAGKPGNGQGNLDKPSAQ